MTSLASRLFCTLSANAFHNSRRFKVVQSSAAGMIACSDCCHNNASSPSRYLHTTTSSSGRQKDPGPTAWPEYNKYVWPPQEPGETRRRAEVFHFKRQIKYSPRKMWYVATMIRGMTIDEAIKQLTFVNKKGAVIVKRVLLEAQELAVKEHNVEFKSNLYIADSLVVKGRTIKGVRRHAKGRMGVIHYRYCHYLVRLREGKPPAGKLPETGQTVMEEFIKLHRQKELKYIL